MTTDLRAASRRELQLDAISSLLIVAMVLIIGMLLWLLPSSGVQLPEWFPLANYVPRLLLGGFVLLLVLYLWDRRRRLHAEVERALAEMEAARAELADTCRWLSFLYEATSKLSAEGVEGGIESVLSGAAKLFDADAATVLGQDGEYVFIAPDTPTGEAERALTHVALSVTGRSTPLHIQSLGTEEGQALAVPLRVQEDLRYVLCLWRRTDAFAPEQLDTLGLLGRMVELAMEREESILDARRQLDGTLRVLQYAVADKRPDYSEHAERVADLAVRLGEKLGLGSASGKALRMAGLFHDVGMMGLPRDISDAGRPLTAEETVLVREHPRIGAEIAHAANFGDVICTAIRQHHERMDGSGYPSGLHGQQTAWEARILAVCEVYDSMTHRTYHSADARSDNAENELLENAGTLYDADVVTALFELVGRPVADEESPQTELASVPQPQLDA